MANVLSQDNSAARGIRTGLQALGGMLIGLPIVIWSVPGVPEAVWNYLTQNFPTAIATFGLPSVLAAAIAWIWNRARGVQ